MILPQQLKLELVLVACALVLDIERRLGRDIEALAGDLNGERFVFLERVRQPPQLGDKLRASVKAFDVSCGTSRHGSRSLSDVAYSDFNPSPAHKSA